MHWHFRGIWQNYLQIWKVLQPGKFGHSTEEHFHRGDSRSIPFQLLVHDAIRKALQQKNTGIVNSGAPVFSLLSWPQWAVTQRQLSKRWNINCTLTVNRNSSPPHPICRFGQPTNSFSTQESNCSYQLSNDVIFLFSILAFDTGFTLNHFIHLSDHWTRPSCSSVISNLEAPACKPNRAARWGS